MTKMPNKKFMAALIDKIVVRDPDAEATEAMAARLLFYADLLGCKKCVICQGSKCPSIRG